MSVTLRDEHNALASRVLPLGWILPGIGSASGQYAVCATSALTGTLAIATHEDHERQLGAWTSVALELSRPTSKKMVVALELRGAQPLRQTIVELDKQLTPVLQGQRYVGTKALEALDLYS